MSVSRSEKTSGLESHSSSSTSLASSGGLEHAEQDMEILTFTIENNRYEFESVNAQIESNDLNSLPPYQGAKDPTPLSAAAVTAMNTALLEITNRIIAAKVNIIDSKNCFNHTGLSGNSNSLRAGDGVIMRFEQPRVIKGSIIGPSDLYPCLISVNSDENSGFVELLAGVNYIIHGDPDAVVMRKVFAAPVATVINALKLKYLTQLPTPGLYSILRDGRFVAQTMLLPEYAYPQPPEGYGFQARVHWKGSVYVSNDEVMTGYGVIEAPMTWNCYMTRGMIKKVSKAIDDVSRRTGGALSWASLSRECDFSALCIMKIIALNPRLLLKTSSRNLCVLRDPDEKIDGIEREFLTPASLTGREIKALHMHESAQAIWSIPRGQYVKEGLRSSVERKEMSNVHHLVSGHGEAFWIYEGTRYWGSKPSNRQ